MNNFFYFFPVRFIYAINNFHVYELAYLIKLKAWNFQFFPILSHSFCFDCFSVSIMSPAILAWAKVSGALCG